MTKRKPKRMKLWRGWFRAWRRADGEWVLEPSVQSVADPTGQYPYPLNSGYKWVRVEVREIPPKPRKRAKRKEKR